MEIDSSPVEIDELRRAVDRLKMEELALEHETDPASRERLERLRKDLADRSEQLAALTARWEQEKAGLNRVGDLKAQLDDLRSQAERLQREGDLAGASQLLYGSIPALESELSEAERGRGVDLHGRRRGADGQGGGRPGRHRRRHQRLDRHPRRSAAGGRDREAAADGGVPRRPPDRPEDRGPCGQRRRTPQPRRDRRPRPADRVVPVPRPHRRRQDRAGQVARRLPLRRRAGDGPHRHERVQRAAQRRPADRGAPRLRRLRGGRPAHRGGPPPALLGGAARRGGEGPPRDVRHPAAGARRRAADRRPGPHGRLPQRHPRADLQPRVAVPHRPDAGRRGQARGGHGGGAQLPSSRSSSTGSTRSSSSTP